MPQVLLPNSCTPKQYLELQHSRKVATKIEFAFARNGDPQTDVFALRFMLVITDDSKNIEPIDDVQGNVLTIGMNLEIFKIFSISSTALQVPIKNIVPIKNHSER